MQRRVGPSLQLRLLDVLTDASLALNGQLPAAHVEVRLAGRNPDLVLVEDRSPTRSGPDTRVTTSAPGSPSGCPRR